MILILLFSSFSSLNLVPQAKAAGDFTTTDVTLNPSTVNRGGKTQITATVTDLTSQNHPTGAVTFLDSYGGTFGIPSCKQSGNNQLVCTVSYTTPAIPPSGNIITITAQYADVGFEFSQGTADLTILDGDSTTTSVTLSQTAVLPGDTITLDAFVIDTTPTKTLTGEPTFSDGNSGGQFDAISCNPLGSTEIECTGSYKAPTPAPAGGSVTITVSYDQPGFQPSSGTAKLTVGDATSTTIVLSAPSVLPGDTITANAFVFDTTQAKIPTGQPTLSDGGAGGKFGAIKCNPNGTNELVCQALYTVPKKPKSDTISMTASYSAAGFLPSQNLELLHVVLDLTGTQVTLDPTEVNVGGITTVTATISDIINSANPVTGKATFSDGGSGGTFGAIACNSGINGLVCTVPYTASKTPPLDGFVTITASYSDPSFQPSQGSAQLTVKLDLTTTEVSLNPTTVDADKTTQVTATITDTTSQTIPTGQPTFSDGGAGGSFGGMACNPSGNNQLVCIIQYTAPKTPPSSGTVTITALYNQQNFQQSQGSTELRVNNPGYPTHFYTRLLPGEIPMRSGDTFPLYPSIYSDFGLATVVGTINTDDSGAGGIFSAADCSPSRDVPSGLGCYFTYKISPDAQIGDRIRMTISYTGGTSYELGRPDIFAPSQKLITIVICCDTTTSVTPNSASALAGDTTAFEVRLSAYYYPSGEITLSDNGKGGIFDLNPLLLASCNHSGDDSDIHCNIKYTASSTAKPGDTITITAKYPGDVHDTASQGSADLTVVGNPTGIAFSDDHNGSSHCGCPLDTDTTVGAGKTASINMVVYPLGNAVLFPTGTITFDDGGAGGSFDFAQQTLDNCSEHPDYSSRGCGVKYTPKSTAQPGDIITITAKYSGDVVYAPNQASTELTVNSQDSSRLVVLLLNGYVTGLGGEIAIDAHVTDTASSPTFPTGTMTFDDGGDGGSFGPISCVNAGYNRMACLVSYISTTGPGGSHVVTITAKYPGDGTVGPSEGSAGLTVIGIDSTSTNVSLNPTTVDLGGKTTGTITITDTTFSRVPSGTPIPDDGGAGGRFFPENISCNPQGNNEQVCHFTYAAPATTPDSTITITASYPADASFAASQGSADLTVGVDPTTTEVSVDSHSSFNPGDTTQVSATITNTATSPKNPTVQPKFSDGIADENFGTIVCNPAGNNKLECNVPYKIPTTAKPGDKITITANYDETGFQPSHDSKELKVEGDISTTKVTITPETASPGDTVSVTATVSDDTSNNNPTGTVTFDDGSGIKENFGDISCDSGNNPLHCVTKYTVPATAKPGDKITITANYDEKNFQPSHDSAVLAIGPSSLEIKKEVTNLSQEGYFFPGKTIEYSLTVTNHGDTTSTNTEIVDHMPDSLKKGSITLAPESTDRCSYDEPSHTVSCKYDIKSGFITNVGFSAVPNDGFTGDITNTATVKSDTQSDEVSSSVTVTVKPYPWLFFNKSVIGPVLYHPGDVVSYAITIHNLGNSPANIFVKDQLPPQFKSDSDSIIFDEFDAKLCQYDSGTQIISCGVQLDPHRQTSFGPTLILKNDYTGKINNAFSLTSDITGPTSFTSNTATIDVTPPPPEGKATLRVMVINGTVGTTAPVQITDDDGTLVSSGTSDSDGHYAAENLSFGTYTITIPNTKDPSLTKTTQITLDKSQDYDVEINIKKYEIPPFLQIIEVDTCTNTEGSSIKGVSTLFKQFQAFAAGVVCRPNNKNPIADTDDLTVLGKADYAFGNYIVVTWGDGEKSSNIMVLIDGTWSTIHKYASSSIANNPNMVVATLFDIHGKKLKDSDPVPIVVKPFVKPVRIYGQVFGPDNLPLGGTKLSLIEPPPIVLPGEEVPPDKIISEVTTNDKGEYEFNFTPVLVGSQYIIKAKHDGYFEDKNGILVNDQDIQQDFNLKIIQAIFGIVTNQTSKQPESSVDISIISDNKIQYSTISDENGRYSFDQVLPDSFTLVATKSGFSQYHKDFSSKPSNSQLDISLSSASLTGIVTDQNNKPLSGAMVSVVSGSTFVNSVNTDTTGFFWFDTPHESFTITTTKLGYAKSSISENLKTPLNISLKPAAFSIYVTGPDKKPLSGVNLIIHVKDSREYDNVFTDATGLYFSNTVPDSYFITATKSGFVSYSSDLLDSKTTQVEIQLNPIALTGYVTDKEDKPLSGVEVSVSPFDIDWPSVITDSTGFYSFNKLPDKFTLNAVKSGYAEFHKELSKPTDPRFDIILSQAAVSGFVKDEDGHVQDNVIVAIVSDGTIVNSITTGVTGFFSFGSLPDSYYITATKSDFLQYFNTDNPQTPYERNIVLHHSASSGYVLDEQNHPLSNVQVAYVSASSIVKSITTDPTGFYSFDTTRGSYRLVATKLGFSYSSSAGDLTNENGYYIHLSKAALSDYVTDKDDKPLSEVQVSIASNHAIVQSFTTDPTGFYSFTTLPNSVTIIATKPGFNEFDNNFSGTPPQRMPIKLLPAGLYGTITDQNNKPLSGVRVSLLVGDTVAKLTGTLETGYYSFESIPADFTITATKSGFTKSFNPNPHQNKFDISLKPAALTGVVADKENRPLSGVKITITSDNTVVDPVTTDATGAFSFETLPNSYVVNAIKPGFFKFSTPYSSGKPPLEISLQPVALSGTVKDQDTDTPLKDVEVSIERAGVTIKSTTTDETGHFEFDTVPPAFHLIATVAGYAFYNGPESPSTPVNIPMEKIGNKSLKVTVMDFSNNPLPNVRLDLHTGAGDVLVKTRSTGADGTYTFTDLLDQTYRVVANPQYELGLFSSEQSVDVTKSNSAEIRLEQGGTITGTVKDPKGNKVVDALVVIYSGGGEKAGATTTDVNGVFKINSPAGSVKIVVGADILKLTSTTYANVDPGKTTLADIVLNSLIQAHIHGTVSIQDRPLPGIDLKIYQGTVELSPYGGIKTDKDGKYDFLNDNSGGFNPYGTYDIIVFAYNQDFKYDKKFDVQTVENQIDIPLTTASIVEGHVLDINKQPLAGIEVYTKEGPSYQKGFTDLQGYYNILSKPIQTEIGAFGSTVNGHYYYLASENKALSLEGGKIYSLDLTLNAGPNISGKVVDKNGSPISGASISFLYDNFGTKKSVDTTTNDAGVYLISVGTSDYTPVVSKPGYITFTPPDVIHTQLDKDFVKDFQLEDAALLDVPVVDGQNQPIQEGITVRAFDSSGKSFESKDTDKTGHAMLSTLKPGSTYTIAVSNSYKISLYSDPVVVPSLVAGPNKVSSPLVALPPAQIIATINDLTGKPVPDRYYSGHSIDSKQKSDIAYPHVDGKATFTLTQSGKYLITIQGDNPLSDLQKKEFDVSLGQQYQYDVVLRAVDVDGDGIHDSVDAEPLKPSNKFSDIEIFGGTTSGIFAKGDQIVTISPDIFNGKKQIYVSTSFSGGPTPAQFLACGNQLIKTLAAGNSFNIKCGSITVQVLSGPIEGHFVGDDGTTVDLKIDEGNTVTFKPDTLEFITPQENVSPIVITIGGHEQTILPGQILNIDTIPKQCNCDKATIIPYKTVTWGKNQIKQLVGVSATGVRDPNDASRAQVTITVNWIENVDCHGDGNSCTVHYTPSIVSDNWSVGGKASTILTPTTNPAASAPSFTGTGANGLVVCTTGTCASQSFPVTTTYVVNIKNAAGAGDITKNITGKVKLKLDPPDPKDCDTQDGWTMDLAVNIPFAKGALVPGSVDPINSDYNGDGIPNSKQAKDPFIP